VLKDGSELVLLRESTSMRARRRKAGGDPGLPFLPDTTARLISFTVLTRTRSGRTRTSQIRLLTTLLDPDLYPAGELAVLYQKRWTIEISFLHLKPTVRGAGRVLRGRSAALARQEAWALLLAHNMIAGLAARAAVTAGLAPARSPSPPCCPSPAPPSPPMPPARTAASAPPAQTRRSPGWTPPSSPSRQDARPPADFRPRRSRTTHMDQRASRLHHHHRPLKYPKNRRKSEKLRAVGHRPLHGRGAPPNLRAAIHGPGAGLSCTSQGPPINLGRRLAMPDVPRAPGRDYSWWLRKTRASRSR
jgi:hypothetical protein